MQKVSIGRFFSTLVVFVALSACTFDATGPSSLDRDASLGDLPEVQLDAGRDGASDLVTDSVTPPSQTIAQGTDSGCRAFPLVRQAR